MIKEYVGKWGNPIQNDPFKLIEKLDISEDPWIKTNFDKYFSNVIEFKDGRNEKYYGHDGLIGLFKKSEQINQYMYMTYSEPWQIKWHYDNTKVFLYWVAVIVYPSKREFVSFDVVSEFNLIKCLWLKNNFTEGVTAQTNRRKAEEKSADARAADLDRYSKELKPSPCSWDNKCTLCQHSFGTTNILCPHK